VWPKISGVAAVFIPLFAALAVMAGIDQAWTAATILGGFGLLGLYRCVLECSNALHTVRTSVDNWLPQTDD